MVGAPSVPGVP